MLNGFLGTVFGAIDWSRVTGSLTTDFEAAVTLILPTVGVIIAAFLVFKTIRRFLRA